MGGGANFSYTCNYKMSLLVLAKGSLVFTGLGLALAWAFGTLPPTCEGFFCVFSHWSVAGSVEELCLYLEWQASK